MSCELSFLERRSGTALEAPPTRLDVFYISLVANPICPEQKKLTRLWYQSVLTYPFDPDGISTGMITVDVGRLSGVSKLGFHHATCKGYCGLGAALGQTNAGVDNATGSRTMISPLGSLGSTSTRRLSKAHGIETSRVIGVRSISRAPSQAHVLPRGFTVGGGGSSKGWGACRCAA